MPLASENIAGYFWEFPEYWNAWKLAFEEAATRRLLIMRILHTLPASWGSIKFVEDSGDDQFILLLTHNLDNDGARGNLFKTLVPLLETSALRFIGTEGATGRIDMHGFFQFPDQAAVKIVAEYMFRTRKIAPAIAAAFFSVTKADVWGIEDPDLYDRAKKCLVENKAEYSSLIKQRLPTMFENLLLTMEERGEKIAGINVSEYNFFGGHSYLSERQISHVGIEALSVGKTDFGRTVEEMNAPLTPLEKLFEGTAEEQQKLQADALQRYQNWRKGRKEQE